MKKAFLLGVLGILFLFVGLSYGADATSLGVSNTVRSTPNNVSCVTLHSRSTATSLDTFASQNIKKVYGPYEMCRREGGPKFRSMWVKADVITGTTPAMGVDYQVISGKTMADTVSSWTAACSLGTSALNSKFNIDSTAGNAIVIRVHNYDATASQIPGFLGVCFEDAVQQLLK